MPYIPWLTLCREVFWRLVQRSAACTVQAKVLGVHRVVCRRREAREVQAVLGKAAQPLWMDPGGNGGCFSPPAWGMLVARGRDSSDLFSCLLLWEASASLKASVPMKGTLEGFKWFGGFRALGENRSAINRPASCTVRIFWRRESQGDFHPPGAPKCPPSLQPSPRLCEHPPLCQAAVARAPAHPRYCSLIRRRVCN